MKMWRKWLALFIAVVVSLSLVGCHQPPPSRERLHVYIVPETVVARPGESIELKVKVEPGQNGISGGEINLSFASRVVQVIAVDPGGLLGSNPLLGIKEIDNNTGKIRFALGRAGDTPVPTPPGVFATIELKAIKSFQGQVCQLTRVAFCNEHFEDIQEIVLFEPAEKPT